MPRVSGYQYSMYGNIVHGAETTTLSDTKIFTGANGFMVNLDGTLAVIMADGSAVSLIVKTGVCYPFSVKTFKSTGSSGVTSVTVLY